MRQRFGIRPLALSWTHSPIPPIGTAGEALATRPESETGSFPRGKQNGATGPVSAVGQGRKMEQRLLVETYAPGQLPASQTLIACCCLPACRRPVSSLGGGPADGGLRVAEAQGALSPEVSRSRAVLRPSRS